MFESIFEKQNFPNGFCFRIKNVSNIFYFEENWFRKYCGEIHGKRTMDLMTDVTQLKKCLNSPGFRFPNFCCCFEILGLRFSNFEFLWRIFFEFGIFMGTRIQLWIL